jgi:oxygen-independent coproporphyrinogen-3 oxidase
MNHTIEHIYIHIPYCSKKCAYCSFFSIVPKADLVENYHLLLQKEFKLIQTSWQIKPKTVYFGGGTPSLLKPDQIDFILHQTEHSLLEEVTIEVNPIHLTEDFIQNLTKTKVNRISVGAQSFLDKELLLLGRLHRAIHTQNGIKLLRKFHYDNLSVDLIYGLPNQTLQDVQFSLEKLLELEPEHISLYCLSLDESVPLFKKRGELPSDDVLAEMYEYIRFFLIEHDYLQYEISNFSKTGYQSQHNLCYWTHKQYLGLGAGASGFISQFRYKNHENIEQYKAMLKANKIFPQRDLMSKQTLEKEYIFLQLRKTNGFSLSDFEKKFEYSFQKKYEKQLEFLLEHQLADVIIDRFVLLPKAYFLSDEIFSKFM